MVLLFHQYHPPRLLVRSIIQFDLFVWLYGFSRETEPPTISPPFHTDSEPSSWSPIKTTNISVSSHPSCSSWSEHMFGQIIIIKDLLYHRVWLVCKMWNVCQNRHSATSEANEPWIYSNPWSGRGRCLGRDHRIAQTCNVVKEGFLQSSNFTGASFDGMPFCGVAMNIFISLWRPIYDPYIFITEQCSFFGMLQCENPRGTVLVIWRVEKEEVKGTEFNSLWPPFNSISFTNFRGWWILYWNRRL